MGKIYFVFALALLLFSTEVLGQFIAIIAILASGAWVIYQFVKFRFFEWSVDLSVELQKIPLDTNLELCNFKIFIANIGKVKIATGKNGIQVTLKQIEKISKENHVFNLREGDIILYEYDLVKNRLNADVAGQYIIEPRTKYMEILPISIRKNSIILIDVKFWGNNNEDVISHQEIFHV